MDAADPDPDALLARWKAGEPQAIDPLLAQYLPALRAFVRTRLSPTLRARESVDDIVQSACREVLEHRDRFEHGGATGFRQWLYMTALRKLQSRWQHHSAQKRDLGREVHDAAVLGAALGPGLSPSGELQSAEELERIGRAFEELTEDQREVIGLVRVLELSADEAGELLELQPGAVRTRLSRALARLAELLDR